MAHASSLIYLTLLGAATVAAIPAHAYETAAPYCREYIRTVTIGGRTQQAYGTACLQPDGAWKIVSEEAQTGAFQAQNDAFEAQDAAPVLVYQPAPVVYPAEPVLRFPFYLNLAFNDGGWDTHRHGWNEGREHHDNRSHHSEGHGGWNGGGHSEGRGHR